MHQLRRAALAAAVAAVPPSSSSSMPPSSRVLLDGLSVIPRPRADPAYRRSSFGRAWADTDRNGCNQRDDVLRRDVDASQPFTAARQGRCDHDMLAGTWHDPYTGRRLTFTDLKDRRQAQAIQIDHVVPLAVAWRYGAASWTDAQRLAYATDLAGLLAVDGPTNASKGDLDAAAWRPRRAYQCAYASRYVAVKAKWRLAVDSSERRALADMLNTC